jgi:hypothetical protein
MTRSTALSASSLFACLAIAATVLAGPTAYAQSIGSNPEQVRAQFEQQGFVSGTPTTWAMSNVTTFTVTDPHESTPFSRVLMVLVYGDDSAATSARERSRTEGQPLVPGYGEAAWQGNVALVQSNAYDLGRYYQAREDHENGIDAQIGGTWRASEIAASGRVDADFLMALSPLNML